MDSGRRNILAGAVASGLVARVPSAAPAASSTDHRPALRIERIDRQRWRYRSWTWRGGAWRPLVGTIVDTGASVCVRKACDPLDRARLLAFASRIARLRGVADGDG